jgi:hypothetical protein
MISIEELRDMNVIAHGDVYVINCGLESELKVWSNGEDEALEIFKTYHKPKNYEVFSIDKLEKDVVRFAI